jgi:BlaI family transcriptional regulator, penicillinase repressor
MKISAAESRVLDVLWRLGPIDSVEATAALAESEGWTDPTVRTLLRRLISKKAVAKKKEGRRFVYRALIGREDYAHSQSETLIDRFFGGKLSPLVLQFSERGKLDKEDLEELKRLIAELDDDE